MRTLHVKFMTCYQYIEWLLLLFFPSFDLRMSIDVKLIKMFKTSMYDKSLILGGINVKLLGNTSIVPLKVAIGAPQRSQDSEICNTRAELAWALFQGRPIYLECILSNVFYQQCAN